MSLFDLAIWIATSQRLYNTYIGIDNDDLMFDLSEDDRRNFVLLVWHSEGCPEI